MSELRKLINEAKDAMEYCGLTNWHIMRDKALDKLQEADTLLSKTAGKPVKIVPIDPEYEFAVYTGGTREVGLSLRMAPTAINCLFADWVNAYIGRMKIHETNVTTQRCKSYESVFFVGGKMGITLKLEKKA